VAVRSAPIGRAFLYLICPQRCVSKTYPTLLHYLHASHSYPLPHSQMDYYTSEPTSFDPSFAMDYTYQPEFDQMYEEYIDQSLTTDEDVLIDLNDNSAFIDEFLPPIKYRAAVHEMPEAVRTIPPDQPAFHPHAFVHDQHHWTVPQNPHPYFPPEPTEEDEYMREEEKLDVYKSPRRSVRFAPSPTPSTASTLVPSDPETRYPTPSPSPTPDFIQTEDHTVTSSFVSSLSAVRYRCDYRDPCAGGRKCSQVFTRYPDAIRHLQTYHKVNEAHHVFNDNDLPLAQATMLLLSIFTVMDDEGVSAVERRETEEAKRRMQRRGQLSLAGLDHFEKAAGRIAGRWILRCPGCKNIYSRDDSLRRHLASSKPCRSSRTRKL
jgi:hypothetical protein